MKLFIRKIIEKTMIIYNKKKFEYVKSIYGIDNAVSMLRSIDKIAIIPVLIKNGAKIGSNCDFETGCIFHNCSDFSKLIIGNDCHIGKDCLFDLKNKIVLEDKVTVSMRTTFITHLDLGHSELSSFYPKRSKLIFVGNNSYIGANATILSGVKIGKFSFIAAGAVVVKDVESFSLVGGIPAKLIKIIN